MYSVKVQNWLVMTTDQEVGGSSPSKFTRKKRVAAIMLQLFFLTPVPCTRTVGYKQSKQTTENQALDHIFLRKGIHVKAFGKIE
jgi:hypothetical protein